MAAGPAGNLRLAALMASAGFDSHKAFASAVRKASAEAGRPVACDHTSVSRWLHGVTPRADTAACITTVLGRALGRPVSLADAGLASAAALRPDLGLDYAGSDDDWLAALGQLWLADTEGASALVNSPPSPSAWREVPLTWLVAPQATRQGTGTGPRVGMSDVRRIRATIGMFAQLDNSFGGGHARHSLVHYLQDEADRLLHGRFTEHVGNALYSVTAQAVLLAAWMSYDSGSHGLAQRHFIQALGLAEAGHDRLLGASILDAMSHQATFLERHTDAVRLASAARSGTRGLATATLTAHFLAMEARALAAAGDRRGCHLALAETERNFERRDAGADPDWFQYFDEAELAAELGHCFRDLGEFSAAASAVTQSAASSCGARSDFFVTMVLADAHLGAGELEQACATALNALRLGEQVRSARCAEYLTSFMTRLSPYLATRAAREFGEQAVGSALWEAASGSAPR